MQCLFWAAFILLLDVSISQDVPMPCRNSDDCKSPTDNPRNVTCIDGYCKCPADNGTLENCTFINSTLGSNPNSTNSTASSDSQRQVTGVVGHVCSMDIDCTRITEFSFCNTGRKQCECKSGYFGSEDNFSCIPGILYNESGCSSDQQCLHFEKNTICTDGVCVCAQNHMHDGTSCVEQKEFGTSCSKASECLRVEGAVCGEQNLCVCPVEKVINPNVTVCLSIASAIDGACIESIQCTQLLGLGGVCVNEHCRCHENHHHSSVSSKCEINRELGGECGMDFECSNGNETAGFGHMRCSSNRCVCAEGFKDIEGKCQSVESGSSAAVRSGDLATLVLGLAYFALLSAML